MTRSFLMPTRDKAIARAIIGAILAAAAVAILSACATVEQAPPQPPPAIAPPDPQIIALTKQIEHLRSALLAVDLRPTYQLAEPQQE